MIKLVDFTVCSPHPQTWTVILQLFWSFSALATQVSTISYMSRDLLHKSVQHITYIGVPYPSTYGD